MEPALIIGKTKHDRADSAVLKDSYSKFVGGSFAPSSTLMLVERIETFFSMSGEPLARCASCEGWSAEELASCPYCGEARTAKNESKPEEKTEPTSALEAMKESTKKPSSPPSLAKKPSSPPSLATEGAPVVATEKKLDEALADLEEHVRASRFVDAGKVAERIRDHLFQQRLENGKPKYKGWQPFVKDEIARPFGVKPSDVDRWIDLANKSGADVGTLAVRSEPSADVGTLAVRVDGLPEGEDGARAFAERFNAAYRTLEGGHAAALHHLATALNIAQEAKLNDRLGMTWEEYVGEFFDLPKRTAHAMQRVARTFTREQVAVLGISKAYELTTLTKAERARFLPEAPKMSVRQLRVAILQAKEPSQNKPQVLPKNVTLIGLAESGKATNVIRLGEKSFVATIPGIGGGALQLACAPDEEGFLVCHVTPIGAS